MRPQEMVRCGMAALAVWGASSLEAQVEDYGRDGMWLGLGLGAGIADIGCPVSSAGESSCFFSGTEPSVAGYARIGGTLAPKWVGAAELSGWVRSSGGASAWMATGSAIAMFYPFGHGIHGTVGLGGMLFRSNRSPDEYTANGLLLRAGAGYDLTLGPNLSIRPYATGFFAQDLNAKRNRVQQIVPPNITVLHIGVGLTRH